MTDSSVVVAIILDKEGLRHWQNRMIYLTTAKPEHGARMLRLDHAFQSAEAKQLLYEAGVIWTWSRTAWEAIDPLYITCLREELDKIPCEGSVAKIVKLEHAWRRLDGRNDDGFQVAPFPG